MDNYQHPKPGKTYISPALPAFGDKTRRVRIASKVLPSTDGYEYVKERDEEATLHPLLTALEMSAKLMEEILEDVLPEEEIIEPQITQIM